MNICGHLERWAPRSLFWRLVSVWVLSFLVLRLFSFVDLSMRSDDVFLRMFAGTEARYMALHMRLLARESQTVRNEFVRQLGRDKELWVSQSTEKPRLPDEDNAMSAELARQLSILLNKAGLSPLAVRASMQVWPQREAPSMLRGEMASSSASDLTPQKDRSPLSILPTSEDRAAQAQAAVEYAPGEWLHLVHNVDLLPKTILYFNLMRIAVECAVMLLLALTTLFWIVRPLQTLSRATEAFGRDMDTAPLSEDAGSIEIREAAKAFNSMRSRILSFVRQRSTLLAAVSHDLRTPLTRMRLRLEGMEDESLRAALLADVEEVQQSLDHMIKTVRTLNAGDPEQPDRVDLMALLESLVEDMQDMGHQVTISGNVPGSFWLPPSLYRRCVENIVGNAVRYAEKADMRLRLENGLIRLDVLDNGTGIPEDRQEHVFEPFYRLETSRNRKTGGYGMGLAIARSLARRYGGDVRLENRPEGGLCVTITWGARAVTN